MINLSSPASLVQGDHPGQESPWQLEAAERPEARLPSNARRQPGSPLDWRLARGTAHHKKSGVGALPTRTHPPLGPLCLLAPLLLLLKGNVTPGVLPGASVLDNVWGMLGLDRSSRSLPCSAWETARNPPLPGLPEIPVAPPRPTAIGAIPPQGPLTPVPSHPAQDTPAGSIRGGWAQSWARVASGPGHVEGRARGPQWVATLQFSRPPRADPLFRPRGSPHGWYYLSFYDRKPEWAGPSKARRPWEAVSLCPPLPGGPG